MKELEVVCGAIKKDDTYFIAKRGKGIDEGFWEFCGGKVEANETNEKALIRELKEELEVDVQILQYLGSVDDIREDIIIHVHAYLCEIVQGHIHLNNHDECHFVKANELYQYQFQKADKKILDIINQ
ncbi:MAG: (deoxy)nucleoside triphosphate pyrophosphohydrolase [Traorella sp.]